ncbi:MAG TPA: hypothetical protein VNO26_15220, partial [Candidatus Limnocylindria bacterium]|nr:hypothetical protein [Candidatus Limnocylindria bacterium]
MGAPASSLWLTLPAPSRALLVGWLAWLAGGAGAAPALLGVVGPLGTAAAIVLTGIWLARRFPAPLECLCRHHLDDTEVTRLGPGRSVARLEWSEVETCTQGCQALVLAGGGRRIRLPLASLLAGGGWSAVLSRVVPARAEALWQALASGAVVLAPAA